MAVDRYSAALGDLCDEDAARRYIAREFPGKVDSLVADLRGALGLTLNESVSRGLVARRAEDRRWSELFADVLNRRDAVLEAARRLQTALHRFEIGLNAGERTFGQHLFGGYVGRNEPDWRGLRATVSAFLAAVPTKSRERPKSNPLALVTFAVRAELLGAHLTGKRLAALEALANNRFHRSPQRAAKAAKAWDQWLHRHRSTIKDLVAANSHKVSAV